MNYECANLTVNIINAVILIGTLIYIIRDLQNSRKANESQNIMAIINFLQDEETRGAREHVISILRKKPPGTWDEWDKAEKKSADKVCSTYDIAAILLRKNFIDPTIFLDNWGSSIKLCYEALVPHLENRRQTSGERYWNDFTWLYGQVIKWEKKNMKVE